MLLSLPAVSIRLSPAYIIPPLHGMGTHSAGVSALLKPADPHHLAEERGQLLHQLAPVSFLPLKAVNSLSGEAQAHPEAVHKSIPPSRLPHSTLRCCIPGNQLSTLPVVPRGQAAHPSLLPLPNRTLEKSTGV